MARRFAQPAACSFDSLDGNAYWPCRKVALRVGAAASPARGVLWATRASAWLAVYEWTAALSGNTSLALGGYAWPLARLDWRWWRTMASRRRERSSTGTQAVATTEPDEAAERRPSIIWYFAAALAGLVVWWMLANR